MRTFLLVMAIVASGVCFAAETGSTNKVPAKFFRAFVSPDGSVTFGYMVPADPSPDMSEKNKQLQYWGGRHRVLMETSSTYRTAYVGVEHDPELQATGITFATWSTASQEAKSAARAKLQDVVDWLVEKHGLLKALISEPVTDAQLAAKFMALGGDVSEPPLLRYCPGAKGNISVNPNDPDFAKLESLRANPATAPQYDKAIADFERYLTQNPTASVDRRTEELNHLVKPLLRVAGSQRNQQPRRDGHCGSLDTLHRTAITSDCIRPESETGR